MEVQARQAGAATGGVGSRAITGGYTTTISPGLVCMRTGNTERHPRDHLHVRPIHTTGARAVYRTWSVRQGLARMLPAARSTAVPCIERVLCPFCLVRLCYRGQCIVRCRCGACKACRDAGNARPGAAASVVHCSWLRASGSTAHAHVLLACLCVV